MAPGSCLSSGSSAESEEEKESIRRLSEQHKELGLHWKAASRRAKAPTPEPVTIFPSLPSAVGSLTAFLGGRAHPKLLLHSLISTL